MPYTLTPDPNYALGHQAMLQAGRRYADRAREVLGQVGEEGADAATAFAVTYLQGLVDMSDLYARATYASSVEAKLAEIDAHIEDQLRGGYNE